MHPTAETCAGPRPEAGTMLIVPYPVKSSRPVFPFTGALYNAGGSKRTKSNPFIGKQEAGK
jgi:hypothetical protein